MSETFTQDFSSVNKLLKQCKFSDLTDLIKNKILDYTKESKNKFLHQIILSIYLFGLLKQNRFDIVGDLFKKKIYPFNQTIFPLLFLEAKYLYLIVKLFFHEIFSLLYALERPCKFFDDIQQSSTTL